MGVFKYLTPLRAQGPSKDDESFSPSVFTLALGTSSKSKYVKQTYETTYTGKKPILVVCTDEYLMEMENKKKFSTGNHPEEMLVPMLHFRDAGFSFDIATPNAKAVKLEMWAFPKKDTHVQSLYDDIKSQMDQPKKLADIPSLTEVYSAIFIPGGHGCMINLPTNADLGRLLREAHEKEFPTVTLCHGPATLLSTSCQGNNKFAYEGYKLMCFTDKTDAMTPSVGYLPGKMPWKCQERLEENGCTILNKTEKGDVTQDRELITGDSPKAAHNLGKFAAPILVKYANEHE